MYDPGTDAYIAAIVRKYSPALLRAAFSVLRNTADAQDAVQEAFLRLLEKRGQGRADFHQGRNTFIRTGIFLQIFIICRN